MKMSIEESLYGKSKDFKLGFIEGLRLFAWWKDGVQYVGTCGTKFKEIYSIVNESIINEEKL